MKRKLSSKKQGLSCVYILYSLLTGQIYVGFSRNFKQRLSQHHQGLVPLTRDLRPLTLLGMEYFYCQTDALKREGYLKTENGQKHLKWMFSEAIDIFNKERQKIRQRVNNAG